MKKLLSIILLSLAINFASAQEIGLKIGDIAPELAYNNPKGNQLKLSSLKGKLVLIDFWASWCGPCRMISPIVDELHTELEGKAVIGKVNVDENSEASANYGVRNIPTILIFKNGEVVDKLVGAVPKSEILSKLESHM